MNSKASKSRTYATILYNEDLDNESYLNNIIKEFTEFCPNFHYAISPLHDMDLLEIEDSSSEINASTYKKPHYHFLLWNVNPISQNTAKRIFEKLHGVGCESIKSRNGYIRYLAHLDSPDKAKYSYLNIKCAVEDWTMVESICLNTDFSENDTIREMTKFIFDNDITSFRHMVLLSMDNDNWLQLLKKRSYYFKLLIQG